MSVEQTSEARTCDGCGQPLCDWCARAYGLTAIHVGPDGKCAYGHTETWWRG